MASTAVAANEAGSGMSRREFLYYVWGASMALLAAQGSGLLIWFLIPRFREGEFGGLFPVGLDLVPDVNAPPTNVADGRFWLVNLDTNQSNDRMYRANDESEEIVGIAAIYKVCTHLGCIYSWTPSNERFECPCHGSKYRLDGRRVEDPAPRSLDRFKLLALDGDGNVLAESPLVDDIYAPFPLPSGTASLSIDTGARKTGAEEDLICDFTGTCP